MAVRSVRAKTQGVIALLRVEKNDVVLVLNDGAEGEGGRWRVVRLFTERKYPRKAFFELALERREFEDIGFNIANRLISIARPDAPAPGVRQMRRK